MRKILLILLYSNLTFSQLTLVSGGVSPITNGLVFTASLPSAAPYNPSYNWGLIYDAGTQVYSVDNPQTGFQGNVGFDYIIFRHNNYWKIGRFRLAPSSVQEYYETVAQYNSVNPPCDALWKVMWNLDQIYPPGDFSIPTGSLSVLTFSSSNSACTIVNSPILCGVNVQCEGLQMAPLSTTTLNGLSIQAGYMAYDAISNSPVWYDGNSWNKVATLDKGAIKMPVRNITSSYSVVNEDYSIVYNGSGSHTITLPGSVYHTGRTNSIINLSSTSAVGISPPITNYGSSISPTSQIILISNGPHWLKMN